MMAACSLLAWGAAGQKTVMAYLDKDGVKHGHRVDGSVLLAGLQIQKL